MPSIGSSGIYTVDSSLLGIGDDTYKQAMDGVMLYYEFATPRIHDITDQLNINPFQVDHGGTITFKQSDLHLPVPNKEAFLIKTGGVVQ